MGLVTAAILLAWHGLRGPARTTRSRVLRHAASLAVALAGTATVAWKFINARTVQSLGEIVPRVETADSVVAITFDDGPFPGATGRILAALDSAGVRATFFLVGDAMERNPAEARAIADAGHEIGNHSFTHRMMVGMSAGAIRAELERTDELIRALGYAGEIHFRSPYGKKLVALPWVLSRTGRRNIFWDVEPESYPGIARDSARIVEHVVERTRPGSIILMHVMTRHHEPSLEAVPQILAELEARGYRFVTVSELLGERGAGASITYRQAPPIVICLTELSR